MPRSLPASPPPPPPALVIFDCDGVLVDSEHLATGCFREALAAHGCSLSVAALTRRFRGRRLDDCLAELEQEVEGGLPADFPQRLQQRIFAAFDDSLAPVPGVLDVVDALAGRADVEICVASSSEPARIDLSLRLTGLAPYFAGRVFSADAVARGKPAPDLFLHAAARMGASRDRCVVVEDSPAGMRAGLAAGMRVLGYLAEPAPAPAGVEVFSDMALLPALLGQEVC